MVINYKDVLQDVCNKLTQFENGNLDLTNEELFDLGYKYMKLSQWQDTEFNL